MKFFIYTVLSAYLFVTLSACGASSEKAVTSQPSGHESSSQTDQSAKTNQSSGASHQSTGKSMQSPKSIQPTGDAATGTTSTSEKKESEIFFYGQWQIKKAIAYGPAGTYSSNDIQTITGKQLVLSKDQVTCFGDNFEVMKHTATHPVYTKKVIAKSTFPTNYRVNFEQLGITGDSVTELDATDANGLCLVSFITSDSQKLILYGGGTFFELDKVTNQASDEGSQNQAAIEEANQNKAVSLVKDYLRDKNDLVQDKNHFVLFEETYNNYYIVRYSTLVSGHSSTNGRYAVDLSQGKVTDISDAASLSVLGQ
ncbi:hypothetical protein PU629_02390 [Pullulanibacillus sp. KACC 23026]|uniref:hypothetical protein n=1 Tax=Pullulanibacillus sp. KACC 23026 TaxID=3028315 RepID=UPI0023AE748B|nr:hypothetical protein [Pullulanibacillus sp. KACC 23026]WEG13233.1 hypothetical protein PU629_02390 [Pullulanibacillus sp. KACC 23026]